MSSKTSYWISDADGTKALVGGPDERDQWVKIHGWTEATEPEGFEFVWLQNEDSAIAGRTRLNWQAAQDPAWTDRGWSPGAPPVPVNAAIPIERLVAQKSADEKPQVKAATPDKK